MSIYFYQIFISVALLFSISFALRNFLTTQKSYFTFVLIIIIFAIIFGGTINNFWYSGTDLVGYPSGYQVPWFAGDTALFSTETYYLQFLFPWYAPGQLIFFQINHVNSWITNLNFHPNSQSAWFWFSNDLKNVETVKGYLINPIQWNILYIFPLIEIIVFGIIGLIIKK